MTTNHQQITPSRFSTELFSEEQWRHIQALLDKLDQRQSLWLSGFLAARGQPFSAPEQPGEEAARICIAYGSETGNCESLAHGLGEELSRRDVAHEVVSLADVKPRSLARLDFLFVICSTHGDGDPPEPATGFYDALVSGLAPPKFAGLRFAVLALGDSSYEHFCTAGKRIDERLEALGGRRLIERADCDVDFEKPAKEWMTRVLALLPSHRSQSPRQAVNALKQPVETEAASRNNPLNVEVLDNICLTGGARPKAIHHLELLIEPSSISLMPGDAVGILPHNPPELVAAILDLAGFSGDEPVVVNQHAAPLVEVLREHLDLSIPGAAFLKYWAEASGSEKLREIIDADTAVQRQFLRSVQVINILREHSGTAGAQAFVDSLRPLQPRLYDVANEITPETDELHLTVKDFRYGMNGREISGTASRYLLQSQPGECLRIYPHHNKRFRLPEDTNAPLILVANGTGVAPFRAFLQHLARQGRQRDCWLLFQETSAEEDFLYQLDLQQAAARGVLPFVDTLFTADHPKREIKDIFETRADRLLDWLARKAHLYLCGEKEVLGSCESELKTLVERMEKPDLWKQTIADKRIHRNLY